MTMNSYTEVLNYPLVQTPDQGANNSTLFAQYGDLYTDAIVLGLTTTTTESLTGSLSAGVAYVLGQRVVFSETAYSVEPSVTSYLDLSNTGALTVTTSAEVTNDSLRVWSVTSSATAVTEVSQIAPIRSSANESAQASQVASGEFTTAPDTGAANTYAIALTPAPAALTPGMMVGIQSVGNTNTGAATLAVNGLSTLPILLGKGTALIGGELLAGYGALLRLNYAGTSWELIWTGAGEFMPPATQSNAAVNLGQFLSSLTPNGYQRLPSGLIIQWGSISESSAEGVTIYTVTLPVSFPSGFLIGMANSYKGVGSVFFGATSNGLSSINLAAVNQTSATVSVVIQWLALGF